MSVQPKFRRWGEQVVILTGILFVSGGALAEDVRVNDMDGLRKAVQAAKSGTRILMAPGNYQGPAYFTGVQGAPNQPVVIGAADPKRPPVVLGRGECLHFSAVSYLELRDLTMRGATGNGLNVDDGGTFDKPSHHVVLRNIRVSDIGPEGNHDGIKLSGLDDFRVEACVVERWGKGGSAIDMVGCHRGEIRACVFRQGGADAVQAKGGTSDIVIQNCRMEDYGERGVNIGGSTDLNLFRPRLEKLPANAKYEAKNIRVEGNVFIGGTAPVAFVGVDGAVVRFNTIYQPRWALRILQETTEPGFVPSRNGVFSENIVVFRSEKWAEGGVNIGPNTAPDTFRFARNVWYCEDRPDRSSPKLPTPETGGLVGKNPLLRNPAQGDFRLQAGSPAKGRGTEGLPSQR